MPDHFSPRWGLKSDDVFGSLPKVAQRIRAKFDADIDYGLSPQEYRTAVAALFEAALKMKDFSGMEKPDPTTISRSQLGAVIHPNITPLGGGSRGFFGLGKNAGALWARAIFYQADANDDNRLSLEELQTASERLFKQFSTQPARMTELQLIELLDTLALTSDRIDKK